MVNTEDLETQEEEVKYLLETTYQLSGYDFREYAQSSLRRRIAKYLSIDFTSMFRDASFLDAFRRRVIPLLRNHHFLHIWHAGCASGEEVLSMAILLEEERLYAKTRIYATDMNPDALKKARRGIFPISRMKEFTRNYLASGGLRPFSYYYTAIYNHAILRPELQKNIVWAQHNLTCDRKFNDFDVIICRNVLIYFNQDLKARVHGLFFESLNPGGILGLGPHEVIQFTPYETEYAFLDESQRLYR